MDLCSGDIFGEDKLFFKCPNKFTVRCSAIKTTILMISNTAFEKNFGKVITNLRQRFDNRNIILQK